MKFVVLPYVTRAYYFCNTCTLLFTERLFLWCRSILLARETSKFLCSKDSNEYEKLQLQHFFYWQCITTQENLITISNLCVNRLLQKMKFLEELFPRESSRGLQWETKCISFRGILQSATKTTTATRTKICIFGNEKQYFCTLSPCIFHLF